MQIKTTIGYHFTPPYWLKLKSPQYPVRVRIGQNHFLQPLWKNLTSPHKCSLDIRLFKTHIPGLYLKTVCVNHSVVSDSLQPHGLYPARLLCPWDSPGKNIEWVVISFSRGSSQPRDQTQVSCIAGRLFTVWATRKAMTNVRACTNCPPKILNSYNQTP